MINIPKKIRSKIREFFNDLNLQSVGKWLFYCTIIGFIAGLGAVLFYYLLSQVSEYCLGHLIGYTPPQPGGEGGLSGTASNIVWYLLIIIPTLGGLVSGALVYTFAPEAEGHGTDAVIEAYHKHKGLIRKRVPFIKTIASIITIGTGGSAGREGPIAQIGAGFASFFGKIMKLPVRDIRILIMSGAAGGIGAIFRAPLGGALFASEVLYKDAEFEHECIIPSIISSITAYSVFTYFFGFGRIFTSPASLNGNKPLQLIFYTVFGLVCALIGILYLKFFYELRDKFFRRINLPNFLKPALGGLILGIIATILFSIGGIKFLSMLSSGYGFIQEAINMVPSEMKFTASTMLILALLKIISTSLTISSGGSGGVFAPSLFIGGMLGGAFGLFAHGLFPGIIESPAPFILVGMGGFFAGVAKVPIAGLIMITEMTGSYGLLVPLMLVCAISFLLTGKKTIYEKQVAGRISSPAHLGDFIIDILEGLKVKDAWKQNNNIITFNEATHLDEIIYSITHTHRSYFPIVDNKGDLTGIFSLNDIRQILNDSELNKLIIASDIATSAVITTFPEEDLDSVLRKFTLKNIEELPIIEEKGSKKLIGMISRRDLIHTYNTKLQELKSTD